MVRSGLFLPVRSGRHCATGWVLVFALLFSLPGLMPAVWGTLAGLEGSHGVAMGGPGGVLQVVLTHPASCRQDAPAVHRHGPLARVLTFAAVPNGTRDHQVNFIRGANWLAEESDPAAADVASGPPSLVLMWELLPPHEPLPWSVVGCGSDLPGPFPSLAGVETTRLLI